MTQVDLRGALTSHYWIPVAGEEEAVSPLPDLPMPTQEIPMLCLSMDSALGIPVAHLGSGREVRREEANQIPASIRGNGEKQLQSAPEGRPGKTLQLELTQRTFQILKPRCPVLFFLAFFFLLLFNTAIRVTSLSKGQQLARVSRKLVWHGAGIIATFNEWSSEGRSHQERFKVQQTFWIILQKALAFQFKGMFPCDGFKPELISEATQTACFWFIPWRYLPNPRDRLWKCHPVPGDTGAILLSLQTAIHPRVSPLYQFLWLWVHTRAHLP